MLRLLDGTNMTKPDYISFSQEIFDECESIRTRLLADVTFKNTDEYRTAAMRLFDVILSNEYGKYLDSIQKK